MVPSCQGKVQGFDRAIFTGLSTKALAHMLLSWLASRKSQASCTWREKR